MGPTDRDRGHPASAPKRRANATGDSIRPDLIDRMVELYCDWRAEFAHAEAAYGRFSSAAGSERALAFAAYTAALDREESACDAYAEHVRLIVSR